jgi:hypothetical protein
VLRDRVVSGHLDAQRFHTLGVMRGLSRPKDGVASLAYDPRIHAAAQRPKTVRMSRVALHHGLPGQARQ